MHHPRGAFNFGASRRFEMPGLRVAGEPWPASKRTGRRLEAVVLAAELSAGAEGENDAAPASASTTCVTPVGLCYYALFHYGIVD